MGIFILLVLFLLILLGALGWMRWKEGRFLKKKASQTMGRELWHEIEKEEKDALRRKKLFENKLKKFKE